MNDAFTLFFLSRFILFKNYEKRNEWKEMREGMKDALFSLFHLMMKERSVKEW